MESTILNRRGMFRISRQLFESELPTIQRIFSRVIPVRCEMTYVDWFEYWGISELFEPVEKGMIIPEYDLIFTKTKSGTRFKFKKL